MVSDAWTHLHGNSPQSAMIGQPVGMFLLLQRVDWSMGGLCSLTHCCVPGYCQSRQLGRGGGLHPAAAHSIWLNHFVFGHHTKEGISGG